MNRSRYIKTGFPAELTGHQCRTLVQLVTQQGFSKNAVKKRFGVSSTVVDQVLAMHRNGNTFEANALSSER